MQRAGYGLLLADDAHRAVDARDPHEHHRAPAHAAAHQAARGHRAHVLHPGGHRRHQARAAHGRAPELRRRAHQGEARRAPAVRPQHERDGQGASFCVSACASADVDGICVCG